MTEVNEVKVPVPYPPVTMSKEEYREAFMAVYNRKFFGSLVNATIVEFVGCLKGEESLSDIAEEKDQGGDLRNYIDEEGFPSFIVRLENGTKILLQLSADEDGNSPGVFWGLPNEVSNMDDFVLLHGKPYWWG